MPAVAYGLTSLAAFVVGSTPTGFLVARAKGVDITKAGSGNIGATNAFRVLGKGPGTVVLMVDAFKGFLPVAMVLHYIQQLHELLPMIFFSDLVANSELRILLAIVAGISTILGHNFTPWLRFKGGKGIATTAGVLLALLPVVLGLAFVAWLVVFLATRYVSLASLAAAVAVPSLTLFLRDSPVLRGFGVLVGLLAIWKHRTNIQRLLSGTEPRFSFSKSGQVETSGGKQ